MPSLRKGDYEVPVRTVGIFPFLTKMRKAIEDISEARGLDAADVTRTPEMNAEKEELTALGFHKKHGKFLTDEAGDCLLRFKSIMH